MVRILTERIARACVELETQARRRQDEIDAVRDVIRALGTLSGMEGAAGRLRAETEELQQEQRGLLDMAQSLVRIREIYMRTDRRIGDHGEGNVLRFRYPEITNISIPVFEDGIIGKNV